MKYIPDKYNKRKQKCREVTRRGTQAVQDRHDTERINLNNWTNAIVLFSQFSRRVSFSKLLFPHEESQT